MLTFVFSTPIQSMLKFSSFSILRRVGRGGPLDTQSADGSHRVPHASRNRTERLQQRTDFFFNSGVAEWFESNAVGKVVLLLRQAGPAQYRVYLAASKAKLAVM
ncbi:MAG: hypothetical protein IPK82_00480 [Polyangiaceae bacterium]|nr:hypothetical protein [Polyangiaceae bacterium]